MENLATKHALKNDFSDGSQKREKITFKLYNKKSDEGWEFFNHLNGNIACQNKNTVLDNTRRFETIIAPKSQKETFHHQYIIKVSAEFSR